MKCTDLDQWLPSVADEELPAAAQLHVDECLRCQAEVARFRKLRRLTLSVSSLQLRPPDELLADVLSGLSSGTNRLAERARAGRRRAAYAWGLSAATVSAGVGVALVVIRSRRPRLAPVPAPAQ